MAGLRVAFQGEPGAYGEDAVRQRWGDGARPLPAPSFDATLAAVLDGVADCAVLPVWNSAIGPVRTAEDALRRRADEVHVEDAVLVRVRHCLLALHDATVDDVRHVASHPAALAQCARFLAAHPHMRPVAAYDTAGAARALARLGAGDASDASDASDADTWTRALPHARRDTLAVIAGARAAVCYGLAVLASGIEDDAANTTRFVVVRGREARC